MSILTPSRFTPVMGTGIVAVALAGLPFDLPGAEAVAVAVWLLAVVLLVVAGCARGDGPVTAYGAPPMALMTVGAGALLVGHRVVGADAALVLAAVLWTLGTLLGLVVAVVVPLRHRPRADELTGAWLMPVVPPVVSAATGAALVPPALCWLLLGVGVVLSAPVALLVVRRLLREGAGPVAAVPTLWIVLGPLGQSTTAVHHLGGPVVGYGVPVLGAAYLWLGVVAAITLRTVRTTGLPFGGSWWAFTFPLGTVVTGTSGLAEATGLAVLDVAAGLLFAGLVTAWAVVASRTLRPAAATAPAPGPARGTASAAAVRARPRPAAGTAAGRTASGRP